MSITLKKHNEETFKNVYNLETRKCMNMVLSINAYLTLADSYAELPKELIDEMKAVDFTKMDITNGSVLKAPLAKHK